MNSSIELINHASVKLILEETTILTDPWYEGSIFHKGWQLVHKEEKNKIINSIKNIDYIYISHEHPDHFSPSFFLDKEVKSILTSNNTKILFQETKDKRVINFLKKNKYKILEISNDKYFSLSDQIKIKIIKFGYIDSAFIIETPNIKILNANDCPFSKESEIEAFKKKTW